MAGGFTVNIAANTRAFQSSVKDAGAELEKFSDTYKELEQNSGSNPGKDIGQDLAKGVKSGTTEASASIKTLEQKLQESAATTATTSASSGSHLSREFKKGAKEAGEGLEELSGSAKQNAIETAASFQGSASSIASGFQAVASEALAGFGPVGLGIGLALSTGIGFFTSLLGTAATKAQDLQAQVTSMTEDLISNKSLVVSTGFLDDAIKAIIEDQGKLNDARSKAARIGITQQESVRAEAGSTKDLGIALTAAEKAYEKLHLQALKGGASQELLQQAGSAENLVDHYKDLIAANKEAATGASFYAKTTDTLTKAQQAQAKASKAATSSADNFAGAIQDDYSQAGSNISDFVKGATFDLAGYTKSVQQQAKDAEAFQANAATVVAQLAKSGHDQAIAYLSKLGPDAAPLIAAFVKAPAAQQKTLEGVWDTLGGAASSSFSSTLKSDLKADQLTIPVKGDFSSIASQIDALRNTKVQIAVGTNTPLGAGVLKSPMP